MSSTNIRKVFGIISYFPDRDSEYHINTRNQRTKRFTSMLHQLEEFWPDTDIIVIAQNWQDFTLPEIKNNVKVYSYPKLGILGARKTLRKVFLESDYDYLIMMDDDAIIAQADPELYISEIDSHPDGIGVIRHSDCPLMFLAISRYVYSQVDMPDIDPEKGEGFEDDLFVATCFAKFPEKAFNFSPVCINEISFKYHGVGAVNSTWAREAEYNWGDMVAQTAQLIENANASKISSENSLPSTGIDLVIPYVNGSDRNWISDYVFYTKIRTPNPVRYRSWGTLRYLMRSISQYLPFINRIVLIVSRESQVPSWINRDKVKVVYHKDFIPKEFLPTFNSCTIETFLPNIKDLSQYFLYFNDDIFVNNPMKFSDFFDRDKIKVRFTTLQAYKDNNIFRCQCRSGLDLICKVLHKPQIAPGWIVRPIHSVMPMKKETLDKVYDLCKDLLPKTVSRLRERRNVNQYIYSYYECYNNTYSDSTILYKYLTIKDDLTTISDVILNSKYQVVCLNDSEDVSNYVNTRTKLHQIFDKKFPNKCEYEI